MESEMGHRCKQQIQDQDRSQQRLQSKHSSGPKLKDLTQKDRMINRENSVHSAIRVFSQSISLDEDFLNLINNFPSLIGQLAKFMFNHFLANNYCTINTR